MSPNRVHVGNLDPRVTQEELQAEVTRYCQPTSVWVARNPPGFAFLEFASIDDAEAVVHNLNGLRLRNNEIKVEFAKSQGRRDRPAPAQTSSGRKHRAVLKNLPQSFGWKQLKDEMRRIGDVIYADVDQYGDGIVEFASEQDLAYAVRRLDGSRLEGNTIEVFYEGGGRGQPPPMPAPPRDPYEERYDDRPRGGGGFGGGRRDEHGRQEDYGRDRYARPDYGRRDERDYMRRDERERDYRRDERDYDRRDERDYGRRDPGYYGGR